MKRDIKKVYKLTGSVIYITKELQNFFINNFDAYDLATKLLEDTDNNIDKVKNILKKMRYMLYVKDEDIYKFLELFNYDVKKLEEENMEFYSSYELTPSVLSYIDEFNKDEVIIEDGMLLIKEDVRDNIIVKAIHDLFS